MRVRCLVCGKIASTSYPCKICGRQNQVPTGKPYVIVQTRSEGTQVLYLDEGERLCATCHGRGHWDSCFDCGNRGYTP